MSSNYFRSDVRNEQTASINIVKLPLQRRLRHLFSLEVRNFSLINTQLSSHVLVHFTLQLSSTAPVLYSSERLPVGVDLCWGGFNIKAILLAKKQSSSFEQHVLASRCFCVKVWKYDQIVQTTTLLVEFNIDMVDLIPFSAAAYVTHGLKYAPNTLVVNLAHGSFAFVLPSSSSMQSDANERQQSPTVEAAIEPMSIPLSNLLYVREPKRSYKLSAVLRMCTVAKALRQSTELAVSRQTDIENKLSERIGVITAEQARERLRSDVEQMRKRRKNLESICLLKQAKLDLLRKKASMLREDSAKAHEDIEDLISWKENMEANFCGLFETLKNKRNLLHWRRGQMIADLYDIYPIKRHDGLCSIAGVPLPDGVLLPKSGANPSGAVSVASSSNAGAGANNSGVISVPFSTMSVAIGYAAHYLLFIHWLFGIPPRYKINFRGSHSAIFDHIHVQLANDADRTFPLYFADKSSYQLFCYGNFLLARVCSQLRYYLTQKKQGSSGGQLLENISWTVHDLFNSIGRVPRPLTATVSSTRQHQHRHDLAELPSSLDHEQTIAASSEHSNSPFSSIWMASRNNQGESAVTASPSSLDAVGDCISNSNGLNQRNNDSH